MNLASLRRPLQDGSSAIVLHGLHHSAHATVVRLIFPDPALPARVGHLRGVWVADEQARGGLHRLEMGAQLRVIHVRYRFAARGPLGADHWGDIRTICSVGGVGGEGTVVSLSVLCCSSTARALCAQHRGEAHLGNCEVVS